MANTPTQKRRRTRKKAQARRREANATVTNQARHSNTRLEKEDCFIIASIVVITFLWEIIRGLFWRYA
ncbi:hypothetical protein EON83_26860 [bacterium]|nr:MAG: hypothetical protein EON83_26860 [bacterium]